MFCTFIINNYFSVEEAVNKRHDRSLQRRK